MTTVRAGLRGVITEILAADGQLVEYGSVLMRVGDGG
jgi:biotin carboxyl carrier protein